jgi:hypothetical protein
MRAETRPHCDREREDGGSRRHDADLLGCEDATCGEADDHKHNKTLRDTCAQGHRRGHPKGNQTNGDTEDQPRRRTGGHNAPPSVLRTLVLKSNHCSANQNRESWDKPGRLPRNHGQPQRRDSNTGRDSAASVTQH